MVSTKALVSALAGMVLAGIVGVVLTAEARCVILRGD